MVAHGLPFSCNSKPLEAIENYRALHSVNDLKTVPLRMPFRFLYAIFVSSSSRSYSDPLFRSIWDVTATSNLLPNFLQGTVGIINPIYGNEGSRRKPHRSEQPGANRAETSFSSEFSRCSSLPKSKGSVPFWEWGRLHK